MEKVTVATESNAIMIANASRTNRAGTLIILVSTAMLSLLPFFPNQTGIVLGILALLSGMAWIAKSLPAFHLSLFATLFTLTIRVLPMGFWPLPLVVSLLLYGILVTAVPPFRGALAWLRPGTLNAAAGFAVLAIVAVSSTALVVWFHLLKPDFSLALAKMPHVPFWGLMLAGAGFALVNAAAEEFAFRGILMSALESAVGAGWWAIAVQAGSFGLFHIHGIPSGGWGIALSGFYGLLLGCLRHYTRGLLAVWLAHVFADLTIYGILFSLLP